MKRSSCQFGNQLSGFGRQSEKFSRTGACIRRNFTPCNVKNCKQFGFCAKQSTGHAILSIIDLIQFAIDFQEFSCGIFLDFSKAFDIVNHNIMIEKLDYYGICGVTKDLFISYLTNRYQYVS